MQRVNRWHSFGGWQERWQHHSNSLRCEMHFSIYLPPQAASQPCPVLWWLSGLTCTDENFVQKAGAQRYAAEHGLIIICPDTSPRGLDLRGEHDSWDFGSGAGFYVNATEQPWANHYRMYDYVTQELPELIASHFPITTAKQSIFGHSMGGHGALICALKNREQYQSVSAFAPICAPSDCAWGQKALGNYLGSNQAQWSEWDASQLIADSSNAIPCRIDQGADDEFLAAGQLLPQKLLTAAQQSGYSVEYQNHAGYDHSYFFIASFIGEHIAFHARHLNGT